MHEALKRIALLGMALLAVGGCASTNLTGTFRKQQFVARGAYAESFKDGQVALYATEYEDNVLHDKSLDEGELVLWVMFPKSATGRLNVQGKRSSAQVILSPFSWKSRVDRPEHYGDGFLEVVSISRTQVHLRVEAKFPRGGSVTGEIVALFDSRD